MRALLVEDDAVLAEFVGGGLREAGFIVDHESDGTAGLAAALNHSYDVAVIDLMLPGRDGFSIIDEMRRRRVTTPRTGSIWSHGTRASTTCSSASISCSRIASA